MWCQGFHRRSTYGLRLLRKSLTGSCSLVKWTRVGSLSALRLRVSESVHGGRRHLREPLAASLPGFRPHLRPSCPGPRPPAPRPRVERSLGYSSFLPRPHVLGLGVLIVPAPRQRGLSPLWALQNKRLCVWMCVHPQLREWSLRVCVLGTRHLGEARPALLSYLRSSPSDQPSAFCSSWGASPLQTTALLAFPLDASIGPTCGMIAGQGAAALTLPYGFPVAVTIALESWGLGVCVPGQGLLASGH